MRVRIAYFAPLLGTGGTQRHLQQVLALLDPARFEARVYTLRPGGEVEDELRASGVEVRSLAVGSSLSSPRSVGAILSAARALRRARVHIVHGYQWRPALVGAIVGRLSGVPLRLASKRSLTGDDPRARSAWRRIGRQVDTVIVNADALRVEGEQHGMRCRWTLLQNGVDTERFAVGAAGSAAREAIGIDRGRPVVGTIGRLEDRKGHDQFLVAMQTLATTGNGSRPQGLIVGDGPLRAALEAQARGLGIADGVRFTGTVADVRPLLEAMDVFVLPSWAEGMSNALMEAMAAGRPVVATAVGGNSEVVADGKTGVLVPPGKPEAIARAVAELLKDPDRAARLGSAARDDVTRRFGARARVAELERLYEERLALRVRRAA
ncbi:MAG TPA: glycosyltransferase [Candidatus Binatia bacterium]|jgi:glycosyltransferase involved in cell wall biosynthesis|nr:glycosyltransferase [Candidatus Binatia bacterium]